MLERNFLWRIKDLTLLISILALILVRYNYMHMQSFSNKEIKFINFDFIR